MKILSMFLRELTARFILCIAYLLQAAASLIYPVWTFTIANVASFLVIKLVDEE